MLRHTLFVVLLLSLMAPSGYAQRRTARVPDGVAEHRNVAYVTDGHERQVLDLYIPENVDGPLPVIIWVHGGAWQNGSKDGCPPLRKGYTELGYAVASLNYRLSWQSKFPAQIEDCKAAIRWLRANSDQYKLDPNRFGVWGSSAGGHLVAFLGTSGDVKKFDVGENLDQSSRVQAVCDFYGPTDFNVFVTTKGYESHAGENSPESKLIGGLVLENPEKVNLVNPITYVTKDDPPFLIVHGEKDPTVPINQSELLFAALQKANVPAKFESLAGAKHGGPEFSSRPVEKMIRDFFGKHLKPE